MSRNKVIIEQSVVRIVTVGVQGPPGTAGNAVPATSARLGVIKLAGDLAGTADAPTVPGLAGNEKTVNKGAAGGYTPLDAGSKVPTAYLPPITSLIFFDANGNGWQISVTTNGNLVTTSSGTTGYPNTYQAAY